MTQKLIGKTAVITGGGSGIGLATARLFAEHGARLLLVGRDEARLLRAQEEIPGASVLRGDVARLDDLSHLAAEARARLGSVDVLFVNAGEAHPTPFEEVTEEQFDATVGVNLKGAFFTIQKLLPTLSPGASVIVTTSLANQMGAPELSVYAACKAALRSLVRSLAQVLISRNIRVNAISPGPIETPQFDTVRAHPGLRARLQQGIPIGRFGDPAEVARVALFLACDDSSFIVGEEIVVDGGIRTKLPNE